MDHYKVLGVNRNATKEEIKDAFRKLAMQFHPDKHAHSPKSVRDGATLRFKQVSLAYEVLNDDRKRADYNLRYANGGGGGFASSGYAYGPSRGHVYGYGGGYGSYSGQNYNYCKPTGSGNGFVSKFELALRFLTTRAFLLKLAFVGAMLGGKVIIDTSREALWKMYNPGKSFEDAMESIEKAKVHKDKA